MFSSAVPSVSCDTFSCEIAQVSKPDTPCKLLNQTKWREKRTVQKKTLRKTAASYQFNEDKLKQERHGHITSS